MSYMMQGHEWKFYVASETSPHPGPTNETTIHNYKLIVYLRPEDKMFHFMIFVLSGRHKNRFLYRSALDPHYEPSDNAHLVVERATERIVATTVL